MISEISGPRQTVLITTRAEVKKKFTSETEEKDNIMTAAWHMPVSFKPPLYAVSIGKERHSSDMIKNSKTFAVNFVSPEMEKEALECGTVSGELIDKFDRAGLEKKECEKIDCPIIKKASAFLECEVINEISAGDHIIFIGKVVNSKIIKKSSRLFQIKENKFLGV